MLDITKEIGEKVARDVQEATLLGDEFYGFLSIQQEYPVLHTFIEGALAKIALLTKDPTEAVRLICMMVVTVLAEANKEATMIHGVFTEKCYIVKKKGSDGAEDCYFIPLAQALDYIQSVVKELAPVGLKEWSVDDLKLPHFKLFPSPTVYLNFERAGMHISGTVVIDFQHNSSNNRVTHEGKFLRLWTVQISVKWPSSTYSPAGAAATVALHQEITTFASLLSAALENYQIGQITDKLEI